MDDISHDWTQKFKLSLRQWRQDHDVSRNQLADAVGLTIRQAKAIFNGETIGRTEFYARIYCYTGISESDPTTIPPRKTGRSRITRSMNQTEWAQWKHQFRHLYTRQDIEPAMPGDISTVIEDIRKTTELFADFDTQGLDEVPHPHVRVSEAIEIFITTLHAALDDDVQRTRFIQEFQPEISEIYGLLKLLSIEDTADRTIAIRAYRRYGNHG